MALKISETFILTNLKTVFRHGACILINFERINVNKDYVENVM